MTIKDIKAKSILRKYKKIDSWFISRYAINLYRGCVHNCGYCDGRSEGYYVNGEFGEDIEVKINAIDILERELDPKRKRVPLKPGFIMISGGVGDSYQHIEKKYKLTRKALELIYKYNLPVHVLTKSTLIKRDIDILKKINAKSRVLISFSLSSVDNKIASLFEPGAPTPEERLKLLAILKGEGLICGINLLPVIPFITDTEELIEKVLIKAKQINLDYVIFGGMTMKEGRQKNHFFKILNNHYPELINCYNNIYKQSKWGAPSPKYYAQLHKRFYSIAAHYNIPLRIPIRYYDHLLDENDLIIVILEQIDYLLKLSGQKSNLGYTAYNLSKLKTPVTSKWINDQKGMNRRTKNILFEIVEKGYSSFYRNLINDTVKKEEIC